MNITIGLVLIIIGLGMAFLVRANAGRPFMHSSFVFSTYPAIVLVFLSMGLLTIVMNL